MGIEQASLSLEQALGLLRRRAPWILFCFVLALAAAYGFSTHQTKKYTATSSLVFSTNQLSQEVAGLQAIGSGATPQALQNTNVKLVQLGDMAARTAALLGQGLSKEKVDAALSVSAAGESNIVDVSATATSPVLAANIANTYTEEFVKEQQNNNHAYYASALALVNKQLAALTPAQRAGTAGLALEDRAQSLGTLAELRNGSVQVAQSATVPTSPSSPKVARNTALGGIVGLLLGLVVAFLLERFDRRIREPKDLETIYGLPLLGVVPESAALSRSTRGKKNVREALPASEAEAFHLIRAHLRYFNVDRELRTLLVASAAPGDGKTTVARHLVEADLRRPTVAQQLDIRSGPGISDVLIGAVVLSEATQTVDLDSPSANGGGARTNGAGGRTLDVLVAGAALPPNPGELIESHAMESLLEQVKSTYDLVVIDTPPLTAVSDAFPLLRKVDGVIIVGRVGRNRRDVAERLHETLTGAGAPLLGVVANGFKSGRLGSYGYAYDYATDGAVHPATPTPAAAASSNGSVPPDQPIPAVKA
jgi:succinoglycan biosynthesis transport protein ExoP